MINNIVGVIVFIFGLIFGSFYNVVGYRLPNEMSIAFPSSHCPNCKHKLKFYELVPVLSYIFLGGKCRVCKKRISLFYPFFELVTGLLFLLCYIVFGLNINFIISVTFVSILIIITISDFRSYIIPDEVLLVGSLILMVELIVKSFVINIGLINGIIIPIINGLLAFVFLYVFKLFGDYIFKQESLGGGDIKLMFVLGLVLGFPMSIVTIFLASFIALPFSVITLIKKNTNILPFGPFISLAAIILLLLKMNFTDVLGLFI